MGGDQEIIRENRKNNNLSFIPVGDSAQRGGEHRLAHVIQGFIEQRFPVAQLSFVGGQGNGAGADLVMTGMPGMASHAPAKVAGTTNVDGQELTLTPAKPLPPGSYRVDWHAVAADTHRVKGSITFTAQ